MFGAGTENEIALNNPKENPLKALMELNENAEQVAKMYAGLQGDEKAKFEREVTGLLFLDNQQTNTTTTRQAVLVKQCQRRTLSTFFRLCMKIFPSSRSSSTTS